MDDAARTTEHEVRLTGLTPATQYWYSVGSSTEMLTEGDGFRFTTSPPVGPARETRIWAIGDSGTASSDARAVRDAFKVFTQGRPADLWLMLGDNAYGTGTQAEYQAAVFDTYPEILRSIPLWPALGNHDIGSPYFDNFTLPTAAEAGGVASGTENYYSFDFANIHFVCLDSDRSDRSTSGAMLSWLRNDLGATTQQWIVAYWHHAPYTRGSHDSDGEGALIEMRGNVVPILEAHGVDLVLCGHSHVYERSFLLDGHYDVSATLTPDMILDGGSGRESGTGAYRKAGGAHAGTVYAVCGCSGRVDSGPLDHPAMHVSLGTSGCRNRSPAGTTRIR